MPNLPISQLPSASALTGPELFVTVQGGVTKQVQISQIANAISPGKLIQSVGFVGNNLVFYYTDGTTSSWSTTINGTAIPATSTLLVSGGVAYTVTVGAGGSGGCSGGNSGPAVGTANGPDINMGSGGGGSDCGPTSSGGGAVSIIGGVVQVDGTITMNGTSASNC